MTLKCELIDLYKYGRKYGKTHRDGTIVRKGYNRALGGISNVRTFLDKNNNVIKYVHKFKDALDYVTVVNAKPLKFYNTFDIKETVYEKHRNRDAILEFDYIGKVVKDFLFGPKWTSNNSVETQIKDTVIPNLR